MNKLKLGKKKILGFVTAGAIVVTMAGSYATWDTLTHKTQAELSIDKPITLTSTDLTYTTSERTWGDPAPTYVSDAVTFSANVPDDTAAKVSVTAKVYDKASEGTDISEKFKIDVNGSGNATKEETIAADATNKEATFTVSVTPIDTDSIKNEVGGQKVYVELEGTLSQVTTTP